MKKLLTAIIILFLLTIVVNMPTTHSLSYAAFESVTATSGTVENLGFGPSGGNRIDNMIKTLRPTSPMLGQGNFIVDLAKEFNVDPLIIILTINESQMCTDTGVVSPADNPQKPNYNCGGIIWEAAQNIGPQGIARWHASDDNRIAFNHHFTFVPSVEDGMGLLMNYIGVTSLYKGKNLSDFYSIYNPCEDPARTDDISCGAGEAIHMIELLKQYAGEPSTDPSAYTPSSSSQSQQIPYACVVVKVGDPQDPTPTCSLPSTPTTSTGNFVYYCQGSSDWQNTCNLGAQGCGPTSMAMIFSTMGIQTNPAQMAQLYSQNGLFQAGCSGDAGSTNPSVIMSWVTSQGFTVGPSLTSGGALLVDEVKRHLDAGYLILGSSQEYPCAWGNCSAGHDTVSHIFVLDSIDKAAQTVRIRDPFNCEYSVAGNVERSDPNRPYTQLPWYYAYPIKKN